MSPFTQQPHTRILVADDDAMTRLLIREALEENGFTVVDAENGTEALEAVERVRPHLAILDVVMPALDGFAVCAALRKEPAFAGLPVLMLTSLEDNDAVSRAFDAGASDFATKPISWPLLVHRVQYMLRAHRTLQELRQSEARLTRAQSVAKLGYFEYDPATQHMIWSPEVASLLGLEHQPVAPSLNDVLESIDPEDLAAVQAAIQATLNLGRPFNMSYRTISKDGSPRFLHTQAEAISVNGAATRVTGTVQDVTDRIASEHRIRFLAYYDSLTQLPNRVLFGEGLTKLLAGARRRGQMMAVLSVDLDDFKRVNETLGRGAGDVLLKCVAARLAHVIRADDGISRTTEESQEAVARLGDDEFIIALGGLLRAEDAALVANRLLEALREPVVVDQKELFVSASIGIGVFPHDGENEETLLKHADAALHHAKDAGKNCFHFFQPSMNEAALQRLSLEGDLRRALGRRQFVLHYQPQVDLSTGRMRSLEALIRWAHPRKGLIPPTVFIGLAEQTSLIHAIGEWVVADAARQTREWRDRGLDLHVALNLSAQQFRRSELVEMLMATVNDAGVDPSAIELELTESVLMEDLETATETLLRLKGCGFRLALDDFGKGYSSLAYLKRFPIDTLKIDSSFIHNIVDDGRDRAIVSAIVSLAHSLSIEPLAEGVEHAAQRDCLLALGCSTMQGYFFGHPTPAESIPPVGLDVDRLVSRVLGSESLK